MTHINFSPLEQCTKAGLWILTQLGVEKRRSGGVWTHAVKIGALDHVGAQHLWL